MLYSMMKFRNKDFDLIEVVESVEMEKVYFINTCTDKIDFVITELKNYGRDILELVIRNLYDEEIIQVENDYKEAIKMFILDELENDENDEEMKKFLESSNL